MDYWISYQPCKVREKGSIFSSGCRRRSSRERAWGGTWCLNQLVYGFKDCDRILPDGGMLQVVELEVVKVGEVL